ncbi:TonB-dependent receptor [Granulicella sp. S190]|uniref:TonB-dependent receptor n=1 Tax=Granulicella sp. S190 TaxID=1747226 RepID=UPI00131BA87E|nr:TonB-dependent receptor [Granulicella sp. S190]
MILSTSKAPAANSTRSNHLLALVLAFAVSIFAIPAHAQFRASIQGTVADSTGAVIPGATLTLTDTATGHALTAISNGSGVYNFNALPPDPFTLTATAKGFQTNNIPDVHIIPEQPNAINVTLQIGDTNTTVTVNGDQVSALETETASTSGTVDSNQIQHLPSAGRDVFQLVQLAPGVFGDGSQGGAGGSNNLPGTQGPGGTSANAGIFATENGPQAVSNGGQYETNGISIDGISTVSAVWGGTSVITPTEDSVGNVKIVSNSYDAENGRFSGAQVQVTSKSGTNDWHGSLFFRASRPGLNAYQRYNGPGSLMSGTPADRGLLKDTQRFNQYGGSVGGPIWKDHVFAFFAYETQRNNSSVTSTGWYETPAFAALAPANSISKTFLSFPGAAVNSIGLINQTCATAGLTENVNCRTIAGQGLNIGSPITTGLGTQDLTWKSTSNPGVGGGLANVADIANYTLENPTAITESQYNGRIDADVTRKDHASFAIYWVPASSTDYNGSIRAYNLYNHNAINDAFSVIWNHIFSPTFLNEARANAAGYRWNEIGDNPQEPFGLPTDSIGAFGSITTTNIGSFGAPGPSDVNQWTFGYRDIATKIVGNHTIKFGGELTRLYYLNNPTYSARPSYNFYNYWDFLNDAPNSEVGSFNPFTGTPATNRQDTREDLWGFFAQDDWKVRPNLTLNFGLRYSYFGPFNSKQNNINGIVLGSGASTFTGLSIRQGGALYSSQKGNFGPQFGFNYSPPHFNGKFVVRGGYGLNYNEEEIAIAGNVASNPPSIVTSNFSSASPANISPGIVYGIASDPHSLFGYPPNPNTITTFNSANLPVKGGVGLVSLPANLPTIYTQHYSLDTQYQLPYQLVATLGYQGSTTRHVINTSNQYVTAVAQGIALNPLVNSIQLFGNNGASNNNAMLAGLKHQMSHQFQVEAQFQWAKTMDDGSGPFYQDPYPFAPYLARGRSDYNVGKALKIYGLWQPVFFHGSHSWVEKVAGGWSLSGIFNIHTGFPWTPVFNAPGSLYYASSGYSSLRPASYLGGAGHDTSNDAFKSGPGVGGGQNKNFPLASTATGTAYFVAPTAPIPTGGPLSIAPLPQLPGVARNSLDGPGYKDVDATITKAFGLPKLPILGEDAKFEIRADAFNLFNNLNFQTSSISNAITSSNFGQAQTALGSRTVNLQARFSF